MRLEIRYTADDAWEASLALVKARNPLKIPGASRNPTEPFAVYMACALFVATLGFFRVFSSPSTPDGYVVAVAGASVFVGLWKLTKFLKRRTLEGTPLLQGDVTIEIVERGVEVKSERAFAFHAWDDIVDVVQTSKLVILDCGGRSAVIVPNRCLGARADRRAFVASIEARVGKPRLVY